MAEMNRRDVVVAMAALAMLGAQDALGQGAVTEDSWPAGSRVFKFSEMKPGERPGGGWGRAVMHGVLPTGEVVEVHESGLGPGMMPHPPHKHRNTEFMLVREGELEFLNDGKPERAGPGDVIYAASGRMHGLKNAGTTVATYFVVSVSKAEGA